MTDQIVFPVTPAERRWIGRAVRWIPRVTVAVVIALLALSMGGCTG